MANQTVTTVVNYDDTSISGLLNGETITINGGSVTVDSDVRWNHQEAVFGSVTLSATLGGSFLIDGTQIWEVPFSASTGNVPTQNALGSNGVTGGTSGATGELTRVWATGSLVPEAAGGAMPATGYIKLRSKTGTFQSGETITLPGGATVTASGAGKRSWINVAAREATTLTIPRLGNFQVTGDWYEIGTTDGTDDQVLQFPVADECPAVQVETAPGSGTYEWWLNGGSKWHGIINHGGEPSVTGGNTTITADAEPAPINTADPYGYFTTAYRIRENTTNSFHIVNIPGLAANLADLGIYTFRTYIKKETRRYGFVQAGDGANYYGAIIDFDNAGAVVLNPTSGSPASTSTTVTAGTGAWAGWYLVELTLEHTAFVNVLGMWVGTSNSASPTLNTGRPSFVGSASEGIYMSEGQIVAPSSFQFIEDDDVRGKYIVSNPTTGTITFAKRTGGTAGLKPTSGCKVRVPNVILSSAAVIDYTRNTQNFSLGTRYDTNTTAAGAINISHAVCNWYPLGINAFTYTVQNTAAYVLQTSNIASTTTLNNCGLGASRDIYVTPIGLANSFSGGTVTDVRTVRISSSPTFAGISLNTCAGFTLTRVQSDLFGAQGRPNLRGSTTNVYTIQILNCSATVVDDCSIIGGQVGINTSVNTKLLNTKYADRIFGTTDNVSGGYGISVSTSVNNLYVDGFSAFGGLADVHPYAAIMGVTNNCDGIEFRNLGTPTAPYSMGSNPTFAGGNIVTLLSTSLNITLRRLYADNVRLAPIATVNTIQNVNAYNVWGDAADVQRIASVQQTSRGCRWSNNGSAESAVYGTHWEDAFTGTESGRLTIYGNEPLASTADQCSFTFGAGAGFTSAGNISMPNVGDEVIWTMPYYAIGHTGIAQYSYGASATETWSMLGTNVHNFDYEYQIDKNDGSGFSAWKPLLEIGRRQAGGALGTNTLTIYGTEWAAMANPPQVGWYLQGVAANVPAGTTITNIAIGTNTVLTLSNNITVAWATNGLAYFWKDIADEVVSPTVGYKLKVKGRTGPATGTNTFNYLRIPFDTTSVNQQLQYPLPANRQGIITNIRPGSRLQIYNVTTSTEIVNTVSSGSTYTYDYNNGTGISDGDSIRIRLARCLGATASIGYEGITVASANGWSLFAAQDDDIVYNANGIDGTAVTEFNFDYPNIQVDINDPDGETTISRLYAWWANERTTEQGIRTLIGGLIAEDQANYKVVSSRINLKLDNSASTGVLFTGNLRLYRDDGAVPVVGSTSGGGSITLYADKVYVAETGTSGLTASESAKLDAITGIDQNVATVKKVLTNKRVTNPSTGQQIVYDDDNTTTLLSGAIYEDVAGTQPYRGQGVERADRLT